MSKLSEAGGLIFPGGPAPSSPDLWALGRLALLEPLLSDPWLTILLALLLSAALLSLWWRLKGPLQESGLFALLLVAAGLGLTYLCEYIYIQDVFMTRMNTVFKFYYQAWVLLALASTYGVYYVTSKWRGLKGYLWQGGLLLLLAASLIYPWAALPSKMAPGGTLGRPTLDGMAYLETSQPDDYAAIRWLRANVEGAPVILEATGGSYTPYGRVSAFTGLPTLLGWGGHELQWRGNYDEPGRREPDIEALYTTLDQEEALRLLDEYDIRYVYLGSLEIDKYKLSQEAIDKWRAFMEPVYERGEVIIYGRGE
jgi:YYY domain-containing protein